MAGSSAYNNYFAYGADMNSERMAIRQIAYMDRCSAKLDDYEFVFNIKRCNGTGFANIQYKKKMCVYGILYTLTDDMLKVLERFQGVDQRIYTKERVRVLRDDRIIEAFTYIGCEDSKDENLNSVSKDYLEHILCGRDLLPTDYVTFLERFIPLSVSVCPSEEYDLLDAANETEE